MKKSYPAWIILFIVIAIFSCQKKESVSDKFVQGEVTSANIPVSAPAPEPGPQKDIIKRKIIKEGEIYFETTDPAGTRSAIEQAVKESGAYIGEEQGNNLPDQIITTLVIRVPAQNFDLLLSKISTAAYNIERKDIKVLDVTDEFIDLGTRLKNKKELEKRYLQILGQAKKVDDILNIEKQIGALREEIESMEGRLKHLSDRIDYSTLTVTYYKKTVSGIGFFSKFSTGLKSGWNNLGWFIIGLANIWPFLIIAAVILYVAWRIVKRRKKDDVRSAEG